MIPTDGYVTPRCCLSVPGTDERRFGKAADSGADEIVLDLEDSVPPGAKTDARSTVMGWHPASEVRTRIAVRVNPVRSRWCHADLAAAAAHDEPALSVVVPKVDNAGDLAFVDRLLEGIEAEAGRTEPITVQALIESAEGLARIDEIVTAIPRLRAVILGYADLAAALGRGPDGPLDWWLPAQHEVLTATRRAGVAAIDGPYLGVDTDEPFHAAVERAAGLGFDGKWVIHPRQVDAVMVAFTPSASDVERARRVVAALDAGHATGAGAVDLNGQMIDEAIAVGARRTLAKAERGTSA